MLYQTKFRNGNICGHSEKKNLFIILSTSYTCSINRSNLFDERKILANAFIIKKFKQFVSGRKTRKLFCSWDQLYRHIIEFLYLQQRMSSCVETTFSLKTNCQWGGSTIFCFSMRSSPSVTLRTSVADSDRDMFRWTHC